MRQERLDTIKAKRDRYMDHEISHDEYYLWLADYIGFERGHLLIPLDRLRSSADPHFNDIPLALWDRHYNISKGMSHGGYWSLCEAVCVAKAVAREWVNS